MSPRRLTALTAAAVSLAAAAPAMASTDTVGSAQGPANMNVCAFQIQCTYMNYANGKPTDVVRHNGTIKSWTLNTASTGGTVRLRVLRPTGHGQFRFVRSSVTRTLDDIGRNTFPAHLGVKRGDVLGLTNDTSGLYMKTVEDSGLRYFNYDQNQADGDSGKPDRSYAGTRLLLSAKVKH